MIETIIKWTKNHPLYFLMAIMVTYCFFVIVGAQLFVSKPTPEKPIVVVPFTPPSPSPPSKQPTTNISPESLSPNDINEALNTAPVLQQPEIAKNYMGLKVTWEGFLYNAAKQDDNTIGINIFASGQNVAFRVNPKYYPGLGLLKRGAPIKVEGVIGYANIFVIRIDDVKIISY